MKRFITLVLALSLLVVPALLAKDAGNRDLFRVGEASFISESEFVIPVLISHDEDLAAMDIPLTYSAGVTLTQVSFENTAVADFDVKIANIDSENHRVTIGLVKMVNAPQQNPYLKPAAGGGNTVAHLHFKLDDPTLQSVEIGTFASADPSHELMFVYNEYVDGVPHVRDLTPEFVGGQVSLNARTPNLALPTEFSLSQNVPNPFNPSTQVSFALPTAAKVNLSIYNVLGQHVKTLVDTDMRAGYQTVTWDGTDNTGHTVASGVYFYKLNAGDFTATKKMLMLK
ncbi:MAG: T9SS type A sorting domain-containing protein [candidate division Zixibacteria bacterium]|nr:T9SS type A sorting domain-containing protein [candidate division Zixibacteria bacterium]